MINGRLFPLEEMLPKKGGTSRFKDLDAKDAPT